MDCKEVSIAGVRSLIPVKRWDSDAGDVPILVEDGRTGFVVERENDEMHVERMATLIKDRELCLSMGQAGRAKAEQEFGLGRLVSETRAAYRAAGWGEA